MLVYFGTNAATVTRAARYFVRHELSGRVDPQLAVNLSALMTFFDKHGAGPSPTAGSARPPFRHVPEFAISSRWPALVGSQTSLSDFEVGPEVRSVLIERLGKNKVKNCLRVF